MLPCYNLFLQRQSLGAQEHEGRPAARMQRFHLLLRCHVPMSLLPLQQVPGADTNPQSSMIQPPKSLKLRDRKLLPVPSQLLPITDMQANLRDDVSSVLGSCHKGRITIKQAVIFFFCCWSVLPFICKKKCNIHPGRRGSVVRASVRALESLGFDSWSMACSWVIGLTPLLLVMACTCVCACACMGLQKGSGGQPISVFLSHQCFFFLSPRPLPSTLSRING